MKRNKILQEMVIHVYFKILSVWMVLLKMLTPTPKCAAYSYLAIPKGGWRS